MRIKVRRGPVSKRWMVYEDGAYVWRRIQIFNTWHEAITEAIYRSERIKTQCKQS